MEWNERKVFWRSFHASQAESDKANQAEMIRIFFLSSESPKQKNNKMITVKGMTTK
jgi:hypothetical protein